MVYESYLLALVMSAPPAPDRARPGPGLLMSTAMIGLPNSATALRCRTATSRLRSLCANRIMNLATASRLVSSHSGPRVHIAA
jgi:hypothetical protein